MCGIAGIVAAEGLHPDDQLRSIRMRDVLAHRGPDDAGLYSDEHALLAHRRLSIVDLRGGQQPLSNEDQSIWVVFNGEIYNHAGIRRVLEAHGHQYRTQSDTETIVHAYEQWGEQCVHRFRGMFAFGMGRAEAPPVLVRDTVGVKPLYWDARRRQIAGRVESKHGWPGPGTARQTRPWCTECSARVGSGRRTISRGLYKILPGHLMVFEQRGCPRGLLGVSGRAPPPTKAFVHGGVVARFRELSRSIRLRLMSEVPLGMFLFPRHRQHKRPWP